MSHSNNNDHIASLYGTNSCSNYSSKTKLVKALNELNTEINQIYYKNTQIKREAKQKVCLTTKNNNKNNNNQSLHLHTSDIRHSPILFKNKKYIVDENDKLTSKETKESTHSNNTNYQSNNKSIREPYSNCCYSFEDSRCSNSKTIQTIEEIHFVFISLIQKSKNMIRLQENISTKDNNAFDTVTKCEEREILTAIDVISCN